MNFDFRDAGTADANAISELVCSLARQFIGPSLRPGGLERLLEGMSTASTSQRIADGWLHLVPYDRDELCAVVVVKPPQHLYHLFVRSDLQRSGLGSQLFHAADARVLGLTGVHLATVNSSLNAVPVYERFGFVIDGDVADVDGVRFQPMRRDA